jgi:hypothetical protein
VANIKRDSVIPERVMLGRRCTEVIGLGSQEIFMKMRLDIAPTLTTASEYATVRG